MLMEVESVNRVFQSGSETVQALRDVNITVEKAALTILRGRSGSGKTTLMNILGALDKPQSGRVLFDNKDIIRLSERKRDKFRCKNVGFIFQSVALISQMSAYENVEFGLRVARVPAKRRKARAEECLSFVGLSKRMQHRPQELSGGEQQRVAIARAIAHRPQIIFADEPTAELDSHMGLQVIKLFRDLVEKEGMTILMTTHDPNMMELADHVYTLEDGAVVEELHNLQMVQRPDLVLNIANDARVQKKAEYEAVEESADGQRIDGAHPQEDIDEFARYADDYIEEDTYERDENERYGQYEDEQYENNDDIYNTGMDESYRERGFYSTRYIDETSVESVYAPEEVDDIPGVPGGSNEQWRNPNSLFYRQGESEAYTDENAIAEDDKI